MTTGIDANVRLPRLLVLALVLAAMIGPGLGLDDAGRTAAARTAAPPLDLPAMVPTTDDLAAAGLDGFGSVVLGGVTSSGWVSLGDATFDSVAGFAEGSQHAGGQLVFDLDQTGWQRQYRFVLAKPADTDPSQVALAVMLEVAEYADADGADDALTLLTTTGGFRPAREVPGTLTVGDRSEIRRDFTEWGESRLVLMFRAGRLLPGVKVVEHRTFVEPELAPVEAVALRFQRLIENRLVDPEPGLSSLALRLSTSLHQTEFDKYGLRDGEITADYGESAENRAARAASYRDATEVYGVPHTPLPDPDQTASPFSSDRLFRFPDEATAAAWLHALPSRLAATSARALQVSAAPGIGDQAFFTKDESEPSDIIRDHRIDAVQVGPLVAILTGTQVSLYQANQLLTAQAACLSEGGCAGPITMPEDILDRKSGFESR
jgi:hypothetical protein